MHNILRRRARLSARAAAPVALLALVGLVAVAALANGVGRAAAPSATSSSSASLLAAASSGQAGAASPSASGVAAAQSGASQPGTTARPSGSASGTAQASASAAPTGRAPGSTAVAVAPTASPTAPGSTPLPPVTAGPQRLAACSAIPASVAESVVGAGAKSVVVPAGGWVGGQCTWTGPNGSFLLMLGDAASFKATGDPNVTDAASRLDAFRVDAGADATAVSGIGTAAVKAPGSIAGYRGENYAEIMGIGISDDRLPDLLRAALGA